MDAKSSALPTFLEACILCNVDVIRFYVTKGQISSAELNAPDRTGKTGLCHVCGNGFVGVVGLLQALADIDPNLADNEGNTPLIFAAQAGHSEIVSILLHGFRGLTIDHANHHGFTALMKAAIQGRSRCAKLLLMAGASAGQRDYGRGLCAFEWAEYCGRHACAKAIAQLAVSAHDGGGSGDMVRCRSAHNLTAAAINGPSTRSSLRRPSRTASTRAPHAAAKVEKGEHARCPSPLQQCLEDVVRLSTVPVVPEHAPPHSKRRSTLTPRIRVIPRVEITMTSKDDNCFFEKPFSLRQRDSVRRKKSHQEYA